MNSSKYSTPNKPAHPRQSVQDEIVRKKVMGSKEKSMYSNHKDSEEKLIEEPIVSSHANNPVHEKPDLQDGFIRKKIKTDNEESKLSDRQDNKDTLIEERAAPSMPANRPLSVGQTYSLPHTDSNWNVIKQKIQPIAEGKCSSDEILKIIENNLFQKTGMKRVDISLLRQFLENFDDAQRQQVEEGVFPCIAKLVIRTAEIFPNTIPLLVQGNPERVRLSKEQCACLLANMFMGTIIKPKNAKLLEYFNFYVWCHKDSKNDHTNLQKIACLYHYFSEIANGIPDRYIIFERLVLKEETHGKNKMNDWRTCNIPLKKVLVKEQGKIEDSIGTIQVDFANHFLGGYVLTEKLAQEEIIFTISPECIVGILFSEYMFENEAILIQGAETYSKYSGYRKDFKFAGPATQKLTVNQDKVLDREIVAINALNFRKTTTVDELSAEGLIRELNKAYIGFNASDDLGNAQKKPVATGRWGCGVFKANIQVKFLLQWAAASKAGRDMWFYSFESKKIKTADKIIKKYENKTVGDLVSDVFRAAGLFDKRSKSKKDFFAIMSSL